jgi:hypothetical protein
MLGYPKVASAFFAFIEAVASRNVHVLVELPTQYFARIMACVQAGIRRPDAAYMTPCCAIVDCISAYLHACMSARENPDSAASTMRGSDEDIMNKIKQQQAHANAYDQHLSEHPDVFTEILEILFHTVRW